MAKSDPKNFESIAHKMGATFRTQRTGAANVTYILERDPITIEFSRVGYGLVLVTYKTPIGNFIVHRGGRFQNEKGEEISPLHVEREIFIVEALSFFTCERCELVIDRDIRTKLENLRDSVAAQEKRHDAWKEYLLTTRALQAASPRAEAEKKYGQVWNTDELARDFEVTGFAAPYVVVRRKANGAMGSLEFQHSPRFYFNWQADKR